MSNNVTGLVFTLYKTSTLFPVGDQARSGKNSSTITEVGTHIIAANVNGQDIEGLKEPVIITLQLNIREGVCSYSYVTMGNTTNLPVATILSCANLMVFS